MLFIRAAKLTETRITVDRVLWPHRWSPRRGQSSRRFYSYVDSRASGRTAAAADPRAVGGRAAGSAKVDPRGGISAARKWQPWAGPSRLLLKDLGIIEEQADALGLSAPLLRVCNEYYQKVAAAGRLEDECSVVYEILEAEIKAVAE